MQTVEYLAHSLGARPAGSAPDRRAQAYLAGRLRDLGLTPRVEPFTFRGWETSGPALLRLRGPRGTETSIAGVALPYTSGTPPEGRSGVLRWRGRWPLIPGRVDCPRFSVDAPDGAPAAFVLAAPFGQARPLPNPRPLLVAPTVVIAAEEGEELRAALTAASGVIEASVFSPPVREDALVGANLIADLGAAGRRLVVVAHYDSVPGSPGANDNASGVAVLLRLVERFRERLRGPIGLRFLLCGAEEPFLVGSRAYVADLAARGEIGELVACLNLDMLGVGDTFQLRRVEGSLWARAAEATGGHSPRGLAIDQTGAMPSSDHWSFHEVGIASAQLTRVADPAWHTPDDVPARFSAADLDEAEAVAYALVAAALDALSQAALSQPDGVA